jgi:hypothetical protein
VKTPAAKIGRSAALRELLYDQVPATDKLSAILASELSSPKSGETPDRCERQRITAELQSQISRKSPRNLGLIVSHIQT